MLIVRNARADRNASYTEEHSRVVSLEQSRQAEKLLKRCPLQEVATSYQTVVCSAHLGLIRGALAELPTGVQADRLQPFAEPGACVGHLTGA